MADLTALPRPELLARARREIADVAELRALFVEPPDVSWLADNLSVRLSARWGGRDFGEAWETALYLAEEFFQNRARPIAVTDRVTGEALAHLPTEAVWHPAAVPRESGNLVRPMPRLRPDIEGALVQVHHDMAREQQELARREELEPWARDLRVLTNTGRQDMLHLAFEAALAEFTTQLRTRLGGAVSLGSGRHPLSLAASSRMLMSDLASINLAFSFEGWLVRSMTQGWLRAVVAAIVEKAVAYHGDVRAWVGDPATAPILWIGSVEQTQWAVRSLGHGSAFQWGERLVGVRGVALTVEIGHGASVAAEMQFDTWQIEATLPVQVTWLGGEIAAFDTAAGPTEHHAEVVR